MVVHSEIDLDGSVQVEVDGRRFSLNAASPVVTVDFPDVSTLFDAVRKSGPLGSMRSKLRRLTAAMILSGNRLDVRVDGVVIGSLGALGGQGSRGFRSGNVQFRLMRFLRQSLR